MKYILLDQKVIEGSLPYSYIEEGGTLEKNFTYYNMGVSLEVILYSTTHVGPRHVLAHTCQWRHIWLFQSPPDTSIHSLIS